MEIEGGGWARYGRSNQGTIWKYVDEDAIEITLDIIYPSEVKEMIDFKYNHFLVQTDVVLKMQADDSHNPSCLTSRSLPWLEDTHLFINGWGGDHTRVEFSSGSGKLSHRVDYILILHKLYHVQNVHLKKIKMFSFLFYPIQFTKLQFKNSISSNTTI